MCGTLLNSAANSTAQIDTPLKQEIFHMPQFQRIADVDIITESWITSGKRKKGQDILDRRLSIS